ncbi:MAG: DUF11 domain-containing protein [Acidobacteria bacterium]|nr:DUF11 domain-containing protein [Acidobacteriota bacterium]
MRTTHTLKTHLRRALLAAFAFVLFAALAFAFSPLSSVMARLGKSAPVKQILSVGSQQNSTISPVKADANRTVANFAPAIGNSAAIFDAPITKIASPPDGTPVSGGQLITYTVTLTNDAAVDETFGTNRLRVRDAIPANTTYEPGTVNILQQPGNGSSAWTCSFDGGNNRIECLTATGGILREFAVFKFEFKVRVNSNATGAVASNQAQFFNEQQSGVGVVTNSSNTTNHPIAVVDLEITKQTSNPNPVNGGAAFSYTLVVTNHGPGAAYGVLVTDPLPAGIVLANSNIAVVNNPSVPGYGLTCTGPANGQNGTVTCTGNMPGPVGMNNSTATITLVVQAVANQASGVRTNTASVTSNTQEASPNVFPNTASAQINLTVDAPLSISKSGPATVCAGDTFTYHITVNNGGSSTALNATISDPLPANTTFQNLSGTGAFASGCSHNGGTPGTVTCSGVDIPSGMSTLDITVKLATSAPSGNLANTATITNAGTGTIAVGSSTTTALVNHCADLEITKTASPSPAVAGQDLNYTITVKNNGPSDIASGEFVVNDTPFPPTGTTLKGTISATGFSCNGGTTFPCTATATLSAGATATIKFTVTVNSNFNNGQPGGCVSNTASVAIVNGANAVDSNTSNNTSTICTPVVFSSDLGLAKSALPVVDPDGAGPLAPVPLPVVGPNVPPGSVNAGGYIRYDLPFSNSGPSDAINVMITDQIPGNTAFVGALATGGVFVPATQPPAVPFTFTIQAVDTIAPLGPNVSLTCTVNGAAGSQAIYCRPQGNTGLSPSYPDGNLPAGYSGQLTFFVKVNESVSGGTIVSNPANITSGLCPNPVNPGPVFPPSVCGGTADPNTANNTTVATQTAVIASTNLGVTKIVQSAVTAASNPNQTGPLGPATPQNGTATTATAVLPGTQLTYRITLFNNGPSDVSNIRLTDVLPSGLESPPGRVLGAKYLAVTPVLGSGATLTCSAPTGVSITNNPQGNGGSIVCTAPLLAAVDDPNTSVTENRASIDVTIFIDPATKQSLVDVATFDATVNNVNRPVSGSATLTTPVAPTSDLALTKTHTNAAGVPGGPVTAGTSGNLYDVTVTNNGPSAAQMFNLVDTLPPFQKITNIQVGRLNGNGQFVTPNAKDGNGNPNVTCTATPPVGSAGNTTSVTCTAAELPPNKNPDGTVNPAGTFIVRLTFTQDPLTPQPTPTSYQNCVTATSMSTDPVPGNNTNVCDTINLGFSADLSGTKTASPDPVIAGNLLTYTISTTNPGPSAALNLMITDPLPQGTVFISAVASPGATLMTPAVGTNGIVKATWNAAGGTAGGLTPPGVTRTLTIVVRVCPDFQQIRALTDAQMCVPNMTDTATISSDTTDPNPNNNTASFTSTVQAQSDLSISKADSPDPAPYSTSGSPSNITYTITFANAGPSNANGVTVTDVLPKGFTVVGTPTSTVPGTTFTITTTNGITTVVAKLGVLGAANQCQFNYPTSGTIVIVARVPIKHPSITVTNTATILSTNCLPETGTLATQSNPLSGEPAIIIPGTGMLANNRAFADTQIVPPGPTPGGAYRALSEISDQKEGSVLFYPIYTSDATNANVQNTRISITNTSTTEKVTIHLFAVDGASCSILDAFLCLTPNQTSSFLASDFDPGNTGYLMAVAVEDNNGLPRVFNELIGDEFIKFSSGHQANLAAESIAASMMFPAGLDAASTTATLRFDGMNYNRLPRVLASSNIGSTADGNSTMLVIDRIGGNFTTSGALIGNISGLLWDDSENQYSFTANLGSCQYRKILDNSFPRTFTPFNRILPAGRTGWMKFWAVNDSALVGAQINFNATANANSGAFNQGHNLHHMTLTDQTTVVIPIFIPSC